MKKTIIRTYDPRKDKSIVAGAFKDSVFYKTVGSSHYMIKEKGYGIQDDVINQLSELNCRNIIIFTVYKKSLCVKAEVYG